MDAPRAPQYARRHDHFDNGLPTLFARDADEDDLSAFAARDEEPLEALYARFEPEEVLSARDEEGSFFYAREAEDVDGLFERDAWDDFGYLTARKLEGWAY